MLSSIKALEEKTASTSIIQRYLEIISCNWFWEYGEKNLPSATDF